MLSTSNGGNWTVASAAKLLFGRTRSLSNPNPLPTATPTHCILRAPSPSLVSRLTQLPSPTGPADSIPTEDRLPSNRLYPEAPNSSAPSLISVSPQSSPRSSIDLSPNDSTNIPIAGTVKTLCNRGSAILSIHLSEPVIYLTGFEPCEYLSRSPSILRGSLVFKLLKPAKIKSITLVFKGRARTEWPEGIPPQKTEYFEEKELKTHTWTFFNAQSPDLEASYGADATRTISHQRWSVDSVLGYAPNDTPSTQSTLVGSPALSPLDSNTGAFGIPLGQSRSLSREDKMQTHTRGYRNFAAGEYIYNFELPLESELPESIECEKGSVRYELEATIERAGAFKSNISGKTDVILVRNPSEQNLEIYEPICINRTWEDQLHYEILISGKAFPLNGVIPIAFKFIPLAKVRLHRIKVFLTENIEYHCRDKNVHRRDPTRKVLLFEKHTSKSSEASPQVAGGQESSFSSHRLSGGRVSGTRTPPTIPSPLRLSEIPRIVQSGVTRRTQMRNNLNTNSLLGNLEGGDGSGVGTEFEVDVSLPGCQMVRTPIDPGVKNSPMASVKCHHVTIWPNIVVHHWIKIVLRVSKADEFAENKNKRRHFEISIDSPIHLLSCRSQPNACLPEYSLPTATSISGRDLTDCPCRSTNSAAEQSPNLPSRPSPLHTHRPLHLLRQPSTGPPSFDDDVAPPPLLTPPPNYDDLTPRVEVRDSYFDVDGSPSNSDENTEPDAEIGAQESPEEEAEQEEDEEIEDIAIVDMVGLEDLSLGVRTPSFASRSGNNSPVNISYLAGI